MNLLQRKTNPEAYGERQRLKTLFNTFVKRGKACSRNVPYVALPFDPDRMRPELVGFLLHPVPRSGTWRRLFNLQAKTALGSWRRAKLQSRLRLADASRLTAMWSLVN